MASSSKLMGRAASRLKGAIDYVAFWVRRRIFAWMYIRGGGLEVGALHLPLPVSPHVRVRYVDRMDIPELRKHYPELADRKLVPVHVIDDGEKLGSQPDESVDFIIVNHVIEHTEDPIGTIANHLRVIRPGGVLYLGVPNRHRTFDIDRQPTPLEHLVRDYHEDPKWSRNLHLEEWARFVLKVPDEKIPTRVSELDAENYSIHYHVWDPDEFEAMLEYARKVAGLPFQLEALRPNSHEFVVVLRRD
jgi:SAM-dependent methyltransferase